MVQLKQQIDQLSTAEQLLLVEQIWNNIDKAQIELSAEHKEKLDQRLALHKKEEAEYSNWSEVKQRLRNQVSK